MGGMYEKDQPMKIAELGDTIYIAESEATPFGRLVPRGTPPGNMLSEWPVQAYERRGFGGTVDGYDKDEWSKTMRQKMEAYAQWLMSDGWMVSKLANLTKTAGVGKKEKAKQMKDDSLLMAHQHERQMLSAVDTRAETGPSVSYRSRGAFSWIDPDAQGVKPVPEDFRPASGCVYTGDLADFAPSSMETMLVAAATAKRAPVDLTGYVGLLLKAQMSSWAQRSVDVTSQTAIQQFTLKAAEKKLINVVDFFEFDAGRVTTIPSFYLRCTEADGEDSAYTSRSGLFLEMKMWQLCFMQQASSYLEPPKSGGARGYHDLVALLKCLNPLGQCKVETNS